MDVYTPRTYIHSSGDAMSVEKAVDFERNMTSGQGQYDFVELPRARKVGQSYASSIGTTLSSFATAFRVLTIAPSRAGGRRWEVLLINGPGTCVVVAFALMLPRVSRDDAML
jgi:beta-1,4-N-acetylglucosaminyltransferase